MSKGQSAAPTKLLKGAATDRDHRIFAIKQDVAVSRLRLMTNEDLEAIFDLSPASIANYRTKGLIPEPLPLPGAVRWTQSAIRLAIQSIEKSQSEFA